MEARWKEYLKEFEGTVMVPMFRYGYYSGKTEPISLRPGKLATTLFGIFMGNVFEYDGQLALNFYGLVKHSNGLLHASLNYKRTVVPSHVIHFSSVKIEHVERFNHLLLGDFVKFKKYLISLRW